MCTLFLCCFLQAAQIEAEKQRQLEWEKRKKEELLNHKNMEQDIVNNLKSRVQKLEQELLKVVGTLTTCTCIQAQIVCVCTYNFCRMRKHRAGCILAIILSLTRMK